MAKILLLDGNSLAYRAFFALPTDLATASGQVTNAVLGFTNMLIYMLNDQKPDGIAVAFDRPEPTFRHEMIDDYKAGRSAAPDILRQQMGLIRQLVETLKIPMLELSGYEADDIIATLATQGRDRGDDIVVVTGDRDAYQLVEDPHIRVLYNKRGVADYALYDEAGIEARTGVHPTLYPQYAALRGDPSDNLPGVPGVGEKTAAKLINDYGGLDGIFANVDKCTPKLRENLIAHEARVRQNAKATPLIRDVPIECNVEDLRMGGFDLDEARELFKFLEFRNFDRFLEACAGLPGAPAEIGGGGASGQAQVLEVDVRIARDAADAAEALAGLAAAGRPVSVAAAWVGGEGRSALEGLAVTSSADVDVDESAPSPAVWVDGPLLADESVRAALRGLVGPGGPPLRTHKAKELMRSLLALDVEVDTLDLDTVIAAYLVDPARDQYLLEDLASTYAGVEIRSPDAAPEGQLDLGGDGSGPSTADTTARKAVAIERLAPVLEEWLDKRGSRRLYEDIERPLVRVLARMEVAGVRVDAAYIRDLVDGLTAEVRSLEAEIQELAGEQFTVNSTKQLRTILFDKLGLQPQKKTKTGFSTDAASLEKLRDQHPIVDKLLRYREVEKLRSTYGESLLAEVGADGRIHASFNQTVARTGRLSSDQPNLHNIPVRTEDGRRFRRAFVPSEGCDFLVADYNQIELRVIAHLAEDPGLIAAFESGHDVHTETSSRIFGVEPQDVTLAMRSKAKMVSYGLAYGLESFGLAQRLGIGVDEASEIMRAYFIAFPNVKEFMERTVAEARDRGYTETLFGRRRPIPELASGNFQVRQAGERQAKNSPIQGLAADIFKVALVRIDRDLEESELASRLVLQVHDEVILEVPPAERDQTSTLVLDAMRGAADLRVPLEVNVSWGTTWADAKS